MKRDFLKDLGLEGDVIDKIMAENGVDIENAKDNAKKEVNKELKDTKTKISNLEEKLTTAVKERDDALNNLTSTKQSYRLEQALKETGTVDAELLAKIVDQEKLEYSEDEIKGLEEQIKAIKADKPYLFETEEDSVDPEPDNRFKEHKVPDSDGNDVSEMEQQINDIFKMN